MKLSIFSHLLAIQIPPPLFFKCLLSLRLVFLLVCLFSNWFVGILTFGCVYCRLFLPSLWCFSFFSRIFWWPVLDFNLIGFITFFPLQFMLKKSLHTPRSLTYLALFFFWKLMFCSSSLGFHLELIFGSGLRQGPVSFLHMEKQLLQHWFWQFPPPRTCVLSHTCHGLAVPFLCGTVSGLSVLPHWFISHCRNDGGCIIKFWSFLFKRVLAFFSS